MNGMGQKILTDGRATLRSDRASDVESVRETIELVVVGVQDRSRGFTVLTGAAELSNPAHSLPLFAVDASPALALIFPALSTLRERPPILRPVSLTLPLPSPCDPHQHVCSIFWFQ